MTTTTTAAGPIDPVGTDLMRTLKALKLGGLSSTLPERLALARQRKMGHAAFLELVLADEVTRRESRSAMLRAKTAGLDPTMRLDVWDELDDLTYDRTLLSDLTSLRFTEAGNGVLILGPSASARPTSPRHSATSRSADASACTQPAPTSSSPGSAPHYSTTPWTPRSANSPASTC